MDKLRSLEIFLATCESGSFAGAARICGSDPSTVSKAISRLEAQLGLTLVQRSTRQLRITSAGERYARTVRKMMQDLSACEDELQHINGTPSGTLRINSAVCYGHLYLRPLLRDFCARYPSIRLDLELNDLHLDIIENDIDIAIRTGYLQDSRLVARRISPMDFFTCASPQYLQTHGIPRCADDYQRHQWIGFRMKESQQLQPIFLPDNRGEYIPVEIERNQITDDGEAMAYLCEDGFGVAQLPHFLAKAGLESGTLVSLYRIFRPPQKDVGVFAIYPKREFLPAKVRLFIDFLTTSLAATGETTARTWAEEWAPAIDFSPSTS